MEGSCEELSNQQDELGEQASQKILLAENGIGTLNRTIFQHVNGTTKLQRKIQNEIKFLKKMQELRSLKLHHINCSNILHFDFLIQVISAQENLHALDYGVKTDNRECPLRVDIICDNGSKWIKVIARNTKSILDAVEGRGSFGTKSILKQAEEFIAAAEKNQHQFQKPKVIFQFLHKIDLDLQNALEKIGISVITGIENVNSKVVPSTKFDLRILNLDITTLIAYVSALTNGDGGCDWNFQENILTEQAVDERQNPQKELLDRMMKDKKVICCETARQSFMEIIRLLGGPKESQRAEEFLMKIEVLPDVESFPALLAGVRLAGHIKERSFKIFAFGVHHQALTLTSNRKFIKSLEMQGVNIPAFIHRARALTELKEATGTIINS